LPALVTYTSKTRLATVTDGTSNTLLIGEKHVRPTGFGEGDPELHGDSSVYNDYKASWSCRLMGRHRPAGPRPPHEEAPAQRPDEAGFLRGYRVGSCPPGVCEFVFGDGSVRALATSTDLTTLSLLARPDDGQPVPPF